MNTRQAIFKTALFTLLTLLSACSTPNEIIPTPSSTLPPATVAVTDTPSPTPPTASPPTPLACLTEPGQVKEDVISTTVPPQPFLIYLPPCYEESTDTQYPVLYLLHGQTYTQDQWVRLGAPTTADQLIHSGEAAPFIIVFPDDRYWNAPSGAGFGDRMVYYIIPYVDENYRTLTDREHRALGGLSRGGGWTVKLGFEYPELFGSLGLHSPATFKDNAPYVENYIKNIPDKSRPRLWFDIGDQDKELGSGALLEEVLTRASYIHEFHLFSGDHTETYWSAHVEDYLRWYTAAWQEEPQQ